MKKQIKLLLSIFVMFLVSCGTYKTTQTTNLPVISDTISIVSNVPEYENEENDSAAIELLAKEKQFLSSRPLMRLSATAVQNKFPKDIKHIFVIVSFENQDRSSVINQAPEMVKYSNLGSEYTNMQSLGHPSQPNYYRNFFAQSLVSDNNDPGYKFSSASNIYSTLNSVGKTFEQYNDGMPVGYTGFQTGTFYAKHDGSYGAANVPTSKRKSLSQFPTDINQCANVVYIAPDINNSGHNPGIPTADNWYKTNTIINRIKTYCSDTTNKSIMIVTWDEGSATNNVFFSLYGYKVKKGFKDNSSVNQYDYVNLICDAFSAPRINMGLSRTVVMDSWVDSLGSVVPPITCGVADVNQFKTLNLTSKSFTAAWNSVPGVNSYNVQIKVRDVNTPWNLVGNTVTTQINISNLLPNTKYEWQVQSVCNTGNSVWSASGWSTTPVDSVIVPPVPTDTCTKLVMTVKDTTVKVFKTVVIQSDSTYKDTIYARVSTPCDTVIVPPLDSSLRRGMYVSNSHVKIGVIAKENILLDYCKQLNMNWLALYDVMTILGTNTGKTNLAAFIKKANSKGIKIVPVGANGSEFQAFKLFSDSYGVKFAGFLREKETWNGGTTCTNDSVAAVQQRSIAQSMNLSWYGDYIGWESGCPGRFYQYVAHTSSVEVVHCYRSNPLDMNYVKTRTEPINTYLKNTPSVPVRIQGTYIIISAEPVFSQPWLAQRGVAGLDVIDSYNKAYIDPYTNLNYVSSLYFTDDFLMVAIPYKAPLMRLAARFTNYSGSDFKNETTQKSLDMIKYDPKQE
jgi:hypothetical protein